MLRGVTLWALLTIVIELGTRAGPANAAPASQKLANTDFDYDADDCEMHYNWNSPYVTVIYDPDVLMGPSQDPSGDGSITDCSWSTPGGDSKASRRRRLVHVVNIPSGRDQNRQQQQQSQEQNKQQRSRQMQQPNSEQQQQQNLEAQQENQQRKSRRRDRERTNRERERDGRRQGMRFVELHISISNLTDVSKTFGSRQELVFVLNSEEAPVTWNIKSADQLCVTIRCLFWVSSNSKIERNSQLNMVTRQIDAGNDRRSLLELVRRKFGTSPVIQETLPEANVVQLTVATGTQLCSDGGLVDVEYVERSVNGCVARWNEGLNSKDVHIIEVMPAKLPTSSGSSKTQLLRQDGASSGLKGDRPPVVEESRSGKPGRAGALGRDRLSMGTPGMANSPTVKPARDKSGEGRSKKGTPELGRSAPEDALPTVILELHPRGKAIKKHLMLVIKAHEPMIWKVRTKGLRGTLSLITDQAIDSTTIEMQSVQIVNEQLAAVSGVNLVYWTADKYGRAVSYTQISHRPQTINVIVDGGDSLPLTNPRWQNGGAAETAGRGKSETGLSSGAIRKALAQARSVTCLSGQMVVSLWKPVVQRYGVPKEGLSLVDRSCGVQENATHYYWSLAPSECGSKQRYTSENSVSYENIITFDSSSRAQTQRSKREDWHPVHLLESSGAGTNNEWIDNDIIDDNENEKLSDSTLIDDEDLEDSPPVSSPAADRAFLSVKFSCDYTGTGEPLPEKADTMQYGLKLFEDRDYEKELSSQRLAVLEHTVVFAEAAINADAGDVGLLLQECSLQPQVNSADSSQHSITILRNGCPLSSPADVQVISSDSTDDSSRQRFSFTVRRLAADSSTLILTCELSACSRNSRHSNDMPKCAEAATQCNKDATVNAGAQGLSKFVGPVVMDILPARTSVERLTSPLNSGELRNPGSINEGGIDSSRGASSTRVSAPGTAAKCDQVIQVEGLNAPTVIGIAFAAFIIGVCLTGAIWYIHTCTAVPIKKRVRGLRLADTSGDSTPNSTAASACVVRQTSHKV